MRALLALLLLSQFAAADLLELRLVVEAGKGAKTYDDPRKAGEKLTVSDKVVVSERHLAEAWCTSVGDRPEIAINLTAEGEQRMIAATKDARPRVTRMAVIIDGKVKTAPTINAVPLGKNFVIEGESSLEEAKALAEKLRAAIQAAKAASFEIRRVVEAGQGTLKVKLPEGGEELTLSDAVIVNRKDLANFWRDSTAGHRREVNIQLTDEAAKRMEEATKDAGAGKLRLAVLIDGKVVVALPVRARPLGKDFQITLGEGEKGEALAKEIVEKLKADEK